jgi:RNA polymerase sigma factor (sigma-70 family)
MAATPAFEALYRRHFGLVWAVVTRAGIAPGSREDAVQEIWLTVHRRLHSFDGSSPASSWLAGIARHVVWRQIRAVVRARRKLVALDHVAPEPIDDPMLSRERLRGIEGVIAQLEPMFREVFVAIEIFGASGPEAAQQLGLPLNTLYSRLRLARARVHAGLDALEHDPAEAMPRGLESRTWSVLLPMLRTPGAATTTVLSFAGALAAVVIATVAIAAAVQPRAPVDAIATVSDDTAIEKLAIGGRGSPDATVAPAEPPMPANAEQRATPIESSAPLRPASTPSAPTVQPGVDAEAALLATALAALAARDPTAASQAIATHEREFPTGALVLERRVARVRALCMAGHPAQARGEAQALQREHPDRAAVVALDEGCAAGS